MDYLVHREKKLVTLLHSALRESAVVCLPAGRAGSLGDSPYIRKHGLQEAFLDQVIESGFENVVTFTKAHSHSRSPSRFLVLITDHKLRANWFLNEAEVNLRILKRAVETSDGASPFRYFDGATMMSYKFPSRIDEEMYCRRDPERCFGHGFDPERDHFTSSMFHVKQSKAGGNSGRGTFANQRVPAGSYIGLDDCVNGLYVAPWTSDILDDVFELRGLPYWNAFVHGYLHGKA